MAKTLVLQPVVLLLRGCVGFVGNLVYKIISAGLHNKMGECKLSSYLWRNTLSFSINKTGFLWVIRTVSRSFSFSLRLEILFEMILRADW